MRIRGNVFWSWADPTLHHRTHDETLDDGTTMVIQVRLSRTDNTQMFIGVYASSGMALHEESFDTRPGESMTRALDWGVGRARSLATTPCQAIQHRAYAENVFWLQKNF